MTLPFKFPLSEQPFLFPELDEDKLDQYGNTTTSKRRNGKVLSR